MKLKKRVLFTTTLILFIEAVITVAIIIFIRKVPGTKVSNAFIYAFAGIVAVAGFFSMWLFTDRLFRPLENYLDLLHSGNIYEIPADELEKFNPRHYPEIDTIATLYYRLLSRLQSNVSALVDIYDAEKSQIVKEIRDSLDEETKRVIDTNDALKRMNEKILEDLEMAKRVQRNMLPSARNFEMRPEFKVGSQYSSMESLGGDLYDIIRTGRNGYAFLIADVSGHGTAAALITTMVKVSFNANSGWTIEAGDVCKQVNDEMCQLIGDLEYYVTAFYANVNLENGILNYACAGHHPLYLYRHKTREVEELKTPGSIIGAFPDARYGSANTTLTNGDRMLFYTDGITEARNTKGEFYTDGRLREFFRKNATLTPKRFIDKLAEDLAEFTGGRRQDDDRAVMFVEFIGTAAGHLHGTDHRIAYEARELK